MYLTLAPDHFFLRDVFIKLISIIERMLEFRSVRKLTQLLLFGKRFGKAKVDSMDSKDPPRLTLLTGIKLYKENF